MSVRDELDALWAHHHAQFRDPQQVAAQWADASNLDPALLDCRVRGRFWQLLAEAGITLLATREYEHLVMAMSAAEGQPRVSFLRIPHPSGLAIDRRRGVVHLASTRNPNQIFELAPARGLLERDDVRLSRADRREAALRPLLPLRSRLFPGSLYLHDLALVGGVLHGNAVGHNAVVRFGANGGYERAWWPRCIESPRGPVFGRNYLQLNSIAAGKNLRSSFFTASADRISARRPGQRNFPVDGRGVVFSGRTREPVARGLTRPHSARLHRGVLYVLNSGYGELTAVDAGLHVIARLPGWTRGLCFRGGVAFVGLSRVIPRFRVYAPGLDVDRSVCGIFAVEVRSGRVLGSLTWPQGNQIFAVDWLPAGLSAGFPFPARGRRAAASVSRLFYSFREFDE